MKLNIQNNNMEEVAGISAQYPYVYRKVDGRETSVPWHWHEEVEFSYVLRGNLRVTLPGQSYIFQENQGFFINSNILHTMEPADAKTGAFWDSHLFHPMLLGSHYRSIFDSKYLAPVLKNKKFELVSFCGENETQQNILQQLRRAAEAQEKEYSEFHTRNIFSDIWLLLIKELQELDNSAKPIKPASQERIQLMLAFIHDHYPEKLSLDQIADAAFISRRECLRCFQNCIQRTPFEYLMDHRIRMAEKLLRTTDLSITEIALQTGFSNSAYFAKTFKELKKQSPSQYRKSN